MSADPLSVPSLLARLFDRFAVVLEAERDRCQDLFGKAQAASLLCTVVSDGMQGIRRQMIAALRASVGHGVPTVDLFRCLARFGSVLLQVLFKGEPARRVASVLEAVSEPFVNLLSDYQERERRGLEEALRHAWRAIDQEDEGPAESFSAFRGRLSSDVLFSAAESSVDQCLALSSGVDLEANLETISVGSRIGATRRAFMGKQIFLWRLLAYRHTRMHTNLHTTGGLSFPYRRPRERGGCRRGR